MNTTSAQNDVSTPGDEAVNSGREPSQTMARTVRGDRGEGIISTAIAVLIIAALGVVAYGSFNGLFESANDKAADQIEIIGN